MRTLANRIKGTPDYYPLITDRSILQLSPIVSHYRRCSTKAFISGLQSLRSPIFIAAV
jgi:hypothetical protein